MSKEKGVGDSRAVYTPPCVVRISDLKEGAGLCAPGSGDSGECYPNGNSAGTGCYDGNTARGEAQRNCHTAVSYTHLTLPTNREV